MGESQACTSIATIRYAIEDSSPILEYAMRFALGILGYGAERVNPQRLQASIGIYHGNRNKVDAHVLIPDRPGDVFWQELVAGQRPQPKDGQVEFDIIGAVARLLTDQVNSDLPEDAYDPHGRLCFARSFQARVGAKNMPLVNLYVKYLGDLLTANLNAKGLPLWPDGKQCAIGLSHDVDVPEIFGALRLPTIVQGKGLVWHLAIAKRKAKALLDLLGHKDSDQYWCFDQIMEEEGKRGFSSTFFFACINRASEWGTRFDVDYDIRQPRFQDLFRRIKTNGFEIGLHASYNAYLGPEYLAAEKNILEQQAETEVIGLRHHFWHLGRDVNRTLASHQEVGFRYDSSLAFRDSMGFRRSTALPFFPWDQGARRPLAVLQLPMFCKDAHVFVFERPNPPDPLSKLKACIELIKETGGLGVIDWHNRTSFPKGGKYDEWGKAYLRLLDYLAADRKIWVTDLGTICKWLQSRTLLKTRILVPTKEGSSHAG